MLSQQFEMKPCDNKIVRACMVELGLPHFVAQASVARGFNTAEKIEHYLNTNIERDWGNPLDIPGMEQVAQRLREAILKKERIVVFGDFDLDGISATTVMTRGLRALGGNVAPFIPDRFRHGYGLSMAAFEEIKAAKPHLIVTVDCGIANKAEVAAIREAGVEVIITDHHEAGELVPEGVTICDPKYRGNAEDATLAGVGVALKVIAALGTRFGFPHLWRSYTDFAALGTIADMMPFHFQNRALVKDGLEKLKEDPRPSLAALLRVAGVDGADINATSVSFSCVPRLNSAGRLGKPEIALNLLLSDHAEEAQKFAEELDALNNERRSIESELSKQAMQIAQNKWAGQRCLIVSGRGWHEGVKGIVAARLVDKFEVPSFMFVIDGEEARGSGRSVGNIDLFEVVNQQSDLLTRYGGHKCAVGVTLPVTNLEAFENRLNAALSSLDASQFKKTVKIDSIVSLDEMTVENVEVMEQMGPFGQENEKPLLLAKNVTEFNGRAVGASQEHFLCKLSNGHTKLSCIKFRCKNMDELANSDAVVNAIFSVENETWRGTTSVKARAEAILPLAECPALTALTSDTTAEFIERLFNGGDPQKLGNRDQGLGYLGNRDQGLGISSGSQSVAPTNPYSLVPNPSSDSSTSPYSLVPNPSEAVRPRAEYEHLATTNPDALERAIITALIGENTPHAAQQELLDNLKRQESCLGVMATGRGKSLVFQAYAALIALRDKKQSIFIYPLRALMADQACHLQEKLGIFGINTAVLNGDTTPVKRKETYEKLKTGEVDILLTTPEYLQFHANTIERCGKFGFLVVDEAHHINEAKISRHAYADLRTVQHKLHEPTTVALTATATKEAQAAIKEALGIETVVFDDSVRGNLHINDQRNIEHKDDYLAHILAQGGKTVVYVGTREQTVAVARRQRARVPQLAPYVGFYNAGLSREERKRIEDLFRNDEIMVLVATSAFGEGIDIPNIRNVVLYHMPTDDVQFNQMSGRAGRDGQMSWIHLLYGKRDASVNEAILRDLSPKRDLMAVIYKRFLNAINENVTGQVNIDINKFAKSVGTVSVKGNEFTVTPNSVRSAIKVFAELGILRDRLTFTGERQLHILQKVENTPKVELTDSVIYCEGQNAYNCFEEFKNWALSASIAEMTERITHPIF